MSKSGFASEWLISCHTAYFLFLGPDNILGCPNREHRYRELGSSSPCSPACSPACPSPSIGGVAPPYCTSGNLNVGVHSGADVYICCMPSTQDKPSVCAPETVSRRRRSNCGTFACPFPSIDGVAPPFCTSGNLHVGVSETVRLATGGTASFMPPCPFCTENHE